jgi:hypothetical protein
LTSLFEASNFILQACLATASPLAVWTLIIMNYR